MRARHLTLLVAPALFLGCEEGPEQLFRPNDGNPPAQNGYVPASPWVQPGQTSFEDRGGGSDSAGRAQFCDQVELDRLIEKMVLEPIVPDVSVAGIPLRAPDGKPLHADSLLGRPEDGKFCDPTGIYLDAFTWGPTQEVIVFFNQETRLVEAIIAYTQYLGTLSGAYTDAGGNSVPMVIRPRERVSIGGRELDQYTSRRDQADKPNAWLNHANVTAIYAMIRETFFEGDPLPAGYDCVEEKDCDLIYTAGSDAAPQDTVIVMRDVGVQLVFSPEGHVSYVWVEPVRGAPFERAGEISFGSNPAEMSFGFQSTEIGTCNVSLDERLTFAQFKQRCIEADDTRSLSRVSYNVETARDAVQAGFTGMDLGFLRETSTSSVFRDGEAPRDSDVLYSVLFTRSLQAPVAEFRPQTLGNAYKPKLEQRLKDAIIQSGPIAPEDHPFWSFDLGVPFILNAPQRIGELTAGGRSWLPDVITQVTEMYHALPLEQQQMLAPQVTDPLFIIEPFVDAVIDVFSHGESEGPTALKRFRTTDDRRWSIADLSFVRNGVPYRIQVQYSLNYHAVTAVNVERGYSEVDEVFVAAKEALATEGEFYTVEDARVSGNAYGLNGAGITVHGFDRRLGTLQVTLQNGAGELDLVVPGLPVEDRNGYLRQIRGERFEFVPANEVQLYGKETLQTFYVEGDGAIGRIDVHSFKGGVPLCAGLTIRYGDDVPALLDAWSRRVAPDAYRDCEVVFNYSPNGNILNSVASLSNRVSITVVDKRAVTASIWR